MISVGFFHRIMPVDCPIPQHVTGLYVFAVINLICLFHASTVSCDIEVVRSEYFFNSNLSMMNMIVDKYYEFSCICISFFFQRRTLTNDTINSFQDELAGFGPDIPTNGLYVNV